MSISSTFLFSLSGLHAAVDRQAVSANNVSNLRTTGFKAQRATQADVRTGGTKVDSIDSLTHQGPILRTGGALDLTIAGNGYFQVQSPAGVMSYTRDGSFNLDGMGQIVDSKGNVLQPPMTVPPGAQAIQMTARGRVSAVMPDGTLDELGQIQLAGFTNPGGLIREGDNLLRTSGNSGAPFPGAPGQGGLGTLIPATVEGSNVDIATEMVDQIVNQRSFEANTKTIRTADEMLGTLLDLKQ
ncbi:flagellar hook-basal body complex protein [bacterium]|nr:flagellar hook-basal body complex protein [bacterium]